VIIVNVILTGIASLLSIPAMIYFLECMVAVIKGTAPVLAKNDTRPRVAVVVPAHNEEGIVGDTVSHLKKQLAEKDQLVVVADNCTDRTAEEAGNVGADVWVRNDRDRRGKGFAISFAVGRFATSPPDVVIFVDADCRLSTDFIDKISRVAIEQNRPIQSQYLFVAPNSASPLAGISALACLVRNLIRPSGLHHLGFPCHLTGSGMAFPWHQILEAPDQQDNIVEDLALGLDMAIAGHEPMLCSEVVTTSNLPETRKAAKSQRRRWEHGQIATFFSYAPRLVAHGIRSKRLALIALAADLAVPPLALLVTLLSLVALTNAIAVSFGASPVTFVVPAVGIVLVVIATLFAWVRFGRQTVSITTLLLAPFYVLWKLPLYLAILFGKSQKDWVRTKRGPSG
jgi:cellulose synthase/poly-beta-1,6-N-acetylglucosamine synthase-like glycosyltransferase